MVKEAIQIYLRIRPNPTRTLRGEYEIAPIDGANSEKVTIKIPAEFDSANRRENLSFKFRNVFDKDSRQEQVFNNVSVPVIDNFLKGYNGTIFAYGQTGSGKTFTITGGAEKYSDRGIIPRTLSYIFDYINKNKTKNCVIQVSYLEIYNESGYDLLDTKHDTAQKLEDLNKVTLYEDSDSNITLKNLSIHQSANEEEALNLLFIGDTNRMVAETPMNQASTRSHCIFTIHLTSRNDDSPVVTKSKLHLVDLAGSERVYKTGVDGTLLTEAKYINLSLHYLEQVIVALAEKKRTHIPYRNSMMTSVLRDSLGGNCMTSMIATVNLEKKNVLESISTCRFSQRVALIKNDAILNEDVDPQLIISQLKSQVENLRSQLNLEQQQQGTEGDNSGGMFNWSDDELTEESISRCRKEIIEYLEDLNAEIPRDIMKDIRKIHLAFSTIRELYHRAKSLHKEAVQDKPSLPPIVVPNNPIANKEVSQLREIIAQRDTEINILVSLLKKAKQEISVTSDSSDLKSLVQTHHLPNTNTTNLSSNIDLRVTQSQTNEPPLKPHSNSSADAITTRKTANVDIKNRILGDLSVGREEAYEIFKQDHVTFNQTQLQKEELRMKYAEAKSLGEVINEARDNTNRIKSQIGRIRIQNAISEDPNHPNTNATILAMTDEEAQLRQGLDKEKERYKDAYVRLKTLRTQIEHMQHLLETSKVRVAQDFEAWWQEREKEIKEKEALRKPISNPISRYPVINPSNSTYSAASSTSRTSFTTNSTNSQINIPLTGDPKVDADIQKFIAARSRLKY